MGDPRADFCGPERFVARPLRDVPRPRTHVGSAVYQIADLSLSLRNNLIGLQRRVNGTGIIEQPIKVDSTRDAGAEPSVSDVLGDVLEFLRVSGEVVEALHKELARG